VYNLLCSEVDTPFQPFTCTLPLLTNWIHSLHRLFRVG